MTQEDFEAQAEVGECPVCKAQQQNDKTIELRRDAIRFDVVNYDQGKKL